MTSHPFPSEDEIHPELRFSGAGILAMANSGPNTNGTLPSCVLCFVMPPTFTCVSRTGSQFFMTLAPTPFLDNKHTIFGRVSAGMRVLQRLGAVAVDTQDRYVCASPARGSSAETYPKKSA